MKWPFKTIARDFLIVIGTGLDAPFMLTAIPSIQYAVFTKNNFNLMKSGFKKFKQFIKKEWFLLVMLVTIGLIFFLFKIL